MQAAPHPAALPVTQAPPARHATAAAQLLGQHLPGDARLQDKDDARQGGAIQDDPWPPTLGFSWFCGQKGAIIIHSVSLISGILMPPI
jgi:hypothetical protein